jgi:hypothetical protein
MLRIAGKQDARTAACECASNVGPLRGDGVMGSVRSRQLRIRVSGQELAGRVVVDESLVQQPFDGSTFGSRVTEGVPRRHQIRILHVQLVLEPAERSRPAMARLNRRPALLSLTASAKSAMS